MRPPAAVLSFVCVPSQLSRGFFVPAGRLVNTPISGVEEGHPVIDLVNEGRNLGPDLLIVVDDLCVARSWMLPDDATDSRQTTLAAATLVSAHVHSTSRCRAQTFSRLLDEIGGRERYERRLEQLAGRIAASLSHSPCGLPGCETCSTRRLYVRDIVRRKILLERLDVPRRRIARTHAEEIRRLASLQLANYAAQGELLDLLQVPRYLATSTEEVEMMSLTTSPRWSAQVIESSRHTETSTGL